jgi:hypothetical protein
VLYITLSPKQRQDIRNGLTVTANTKEGVPVILTPHLVAHAKAQFAAGQPVVALPEVAGQDRMELVTAS